MNRRTKKLQFSARARKEIYQRDGRSCLFCRLSYRMPEGDTYGNHIFETMHIVSRAHGGLGIAENGIIGCKYHHNMLDSGPHETREEMQELIGAYMRGKYPGWSREKLEYRK